MARGDRHCVEFLQWALPLLRMRWGGFRKVRAQVCKRLGRRIDVLGLPDFSAYRRYLEGHPDEWTHCDALCRITISHFYRDRGMFDRLAKWMVEAVPEPGRPFRAWSVGCASGEEPYTLSLLWQFRVQPRHPGAQLHVLATDSDPHLLERARRACYRPGSLRELPREWVDAAFAPSEGEMCLRRSSRAPVELRQHDLRDTAPPETFDLILCRNLAFTYFDPTLQRDTQATLATRLRPGGVLMLGAHETLPAPDEAFEPISPPLPLYRRRAPA